MPVTSLRRVFKNTPLINRRWHPWKKCPCPCHPIFGAIVLKLKTLSSYLPPPNPCPSLGPGSSFTPLPTGIEPDRRRRRPLGFAGKEMPIVVFIRLTPVSLPFDCCRPHTHSAPALGQETCVVLPTHLG